jgi:hypothetical protein
MKSELAALVLDCVTCVVAALIANDHVGLLAQQIATLPLPSSPHWAPKTTRTGTMPPDDSVT